MTIPVTPGVERKRGPGSTALAKTETLSRPRTKVWKVLTESQKAQDDRGWVHNCGEDVMGAEVLLSVLDGLFPLSGRGETVREVVPYCPKCELEPEGHGTIDPEGNILIQALLAETG